MMGRPGELTDQITRLVLSGLTHTGYLTSSRSLLSLSSLTWDGRVELGLAPGSKLDVALRSPSKPKPGMSP